ncbi:hypothetical protein [Lentzea sp. NEAU-D7]|uniref:hypothetical protein n=1 Tax=Lentzea sp. NEAU-D7 TaxID=2994667 RepID=UPI00224B3A25|nr:hypothetical protein [Lentzea sp. NEAU-D7]MCX2951380.1 hypothetical protein [Lentzea sp. NEAU-D7]
MRLEVFDSASDVPPELLSQQPRHSFRSSSNKIALVDTEGYPALELPAPAAGTISCAVACEGREDAYKARHHEHRENIRDVERWRITIWPEQTP